MRWLIAIVLVCAATVRAEARMMLHFDLAGLVLQAECVVVAEAIGPGAKGTTRYKLVRVLRGPTPPPELEVVDSHYAMSGAGTHRVLFLGRFDGKLQLLASGLRVVSGGLVFRFEQKSNPGPYEMVEQGHDPQDLWKPGLTAQLDLAGLEAAIAAAGKRVDAFAAARTMTDPARRRAAILAVLPPREGGIPLTFYIDVLGEAAQKLLVGAGDLEGALAAFERDHTGHRRGDLAAPGLLLTYATDRSHPGRLRATALNAFRRGSDSSEVPHLRRALALAADAEPLVRASAISATTRAVGVSSSDPAEQRAISAFVADARKAVVARYPVETDGDVLVALADALGAFGVPVPPHPSGRSAVVTASTADGGLSVSVRCLGTEYDVVDLRILPLRGGAVVSPPFHVLTRSGCDPQFSTTGTGVGSRSARLPVGRYDLSVELKGRSKPANQRLGTLVVDAHGAMEMLP
jgi:hypothetical protein